MSCVEKGFQIFVEKERKLKQRLIFKEIFYGILFSIMIVFILWIILALAPTGG